MFDFFYDFSIDIDSKSLEIGVDKKHLVKLYYPKDVNFVPKVNPHKDYYEIIFQNIYLGMDLIFELRSNEIKEYLILREKRKVKEFPIKLDFYNCFLKKIRNDFVVIGNDNTEIFSFSELKIIPEKHNKNVNFESFCHFEYDPLNFNLWYRFNFSGYSEENFPIKVDPTFRFQTKIRTNSLGIRAGYDRFNYMIVSGSKISDEFFDKTIGLPTKTTIFEGQNFGHYGPYGPYGPGGGTSELYKKILGSDDVVFERNCRVMLPFLTGYLDSVSLRVMQDDVKTLLGPYPIKSSVINGARYDYVDFEIPFKMPSSLTIESLVFFDNSVFGDISVSYERTVTYVPELDIKIEPSNQYITKIEKNGNNVLDVAYISCSHSSLFKPYQYSIIPFAFDLPTAEEVKRRESVNQQIAEDIGNSVDILYEDYSQIVGDVPTLEEVKSSLYRNKDKTNTFVSVPTSIESKTPNVLTSYFSFPTYFFPTVAANRGWNESQEPSVYFDKGRSKSFKNHLEFVLKSSINFRSNTEEYIDFKKKYTYIEPEDFYFNISENASVGNGRISLSKDSFDLSLIQKPTHAIWTSNGETFLSERDDLFSISEGVNTTLDFTINTNFFAFEFGSGTPDFNSDTYEIDFIEIEDQEVAMAQYEDNPLSGHYLVLRISGKVYSYEIVESTLKSIVLKGKVKSILERADYLGVFPYIPNEAWFQYVSAGYETKRKQITKKRILNNGDLVYETVNLPIISNRPTEIICNLKDTDKEFIGIRKKVRVRGESEFFYYGFNLNAVKVSVSVELDSTAAITTSTPNKYSVNIGGSRFDKYSIPERLSDRIIYFNVDAPGFADKVVLKLTKRDGTEVQYFETNSDIVSFSYRENDNENRFLEIRLDPKKIDYSRIDLDFSTN